MSAHAQHRFTGRLFDQNDEIIIHGIVHLYTNDNTFLVCFLTNSDGYFKFDLKPPFPSSLIFRLCKEQKLFTRLDNYCQRTEISEVIYNFDPSKKDIGPLFLSTQYPEEQVPIAYLAALATAKAHTQTMKTTYDAIHGSDPNYNSSNVQAAYQFGTVDLTPDNTYRMLTNGICPIYFKRSSKGYLMAEVNWDRYDMDKLASLPNVKLYFDDCCCKNDIPVLDLIELEYRNTLVASSSKKNKDLIQTFKPKDEQFLSALRVANSAFMAFGETVFHFTLGHMYCGKYSQDVHDFLSGTSIFELIAPHCQYVRKITFDIGGGPNGIITGDHGILNVTALSPIGISQLISDTIASVNPFTYCPRKPMSKHHKFAHIQHICYRLIRKAVKKYIQTNEARIRTEWRQIHRFYKRRHQHSPYWRPWMGNIDKFEDQREIGGYGRKHLPKQTKCTPKNTKVQAMPWIAKNKDGPQKHDLYWMELDISHYIHLASDFHSSLHISQTRTTTDTPPLTDLNFSPIAVNNYGDGLNGGISVDEANLQEFLLRILGDFPAANYALVSAPGVYSGLVERFEKAAKKLIANDLNPATEIYVSAVI